MGMKSVNTSIAAILGILWAASAVAQTSRITQAADNRLRSVLAGNVHPKALPANDRAGRPGAAGEQPQHELAAQGVPAEVVCVEPQVIDQREPVVGEYVRRVAGRIVRPRAVPVAAQVGQDDPVAPLGDRPRRAVAHHERATAHQPVQQYQGGSVADLAPGELRAVRAGEAPHAQVSHGATS